MMRRLSDDIGADAGFDFGETGDSFSEMADVESEGVDFSPLEGEVADGLVESNNTDYFDVTNNNIEFEALDDIPNSVENNEGSGESTPDVSKVEFEPLDFESYANHQDFPDNDVSDVHSVGDWIDEINPNFDPFDLESAYDNNCGSCAYAVFQRLEGDENITAGAENIENIEQMNAQTGMEQVPMSPEEIERTLLDQGDGAHAIIGIDRVEGAGHWFNAANIDGKVVAIDGQTGEINDWPPDYGDVKNWDMSMKKEA